MSDNKLAAPAETQTEDDADLDIPELPADFFQNGVVGKYYEDYRNEDYRKTHMIRLEPDVAEQFADEAAVNEALRLVIQLRRLVVSGEHKQSA